MAEFNQIIDTSDISLLYPDNNFTRKYTDEKKSAALTNITAEQLELDYLMELKTCDFGSFYTDDIDVILYRQDTFRDIAENPGLSDILLKMIPFLNDITELRRLGSDSAAAGDNYLYSIAEVELYTSLMEMLQNELLPLAPNLKSTAFRRFAERINTLTGSEYFTNINEQLNELTSRVREIKSVTIGVNLDSQLRAEKAGVLSVNNEQFKSGDLLNKMLRLDFKNDDMTCIAPLIPFKKGQSDNQQYALSNAFNGAITEIYKQSVRSWKKVIQHYVLENTDFLIRMMPEVEFVTKASELIKNLKSKGCPLCHPEIRPAATGEVPLMPREKQICAPVCCTTPRANTASSVWVEEPTMSVCSREGSPSRAVIQ